MSSLEYLVQLIRRTINIIVGILMLSFVLGIFFEPIGKPFQVLILDKALGVPPQNIVGVHVFLAFFFTIWGLAAIFNGGKK